MGKAACNAGAADCMGTAGAGKLGGLSKLAWHGAMLPLCPLVVADLSREAGCG